MITSFDSRITLTMSKSKRCKYISKINAGLGGTMSMKLKRCVLRRRTHLDTSVCTLWNGKKQCVIYFGAWTIWRVYGNAKYINRWLCNRSRPVDQHYLKELEALGHRFWRWKWLIMLHASVDGSLKRWWSIFDMVNGGGTEIDLMAAELAEGVTTIRKQRAAWNYDLARNVD